MLNNEKIKCYGGLLPIFQVATNESELKLIYWHWIWWLETSKNTCRYKSVLDNSSLHSKDTKYHHLKDADIQRNTHYLIKSTKDIQSERRKAEAVKFLNTS